MKKYSFLFLAALMLFFVRCSEDDNKEYYSVLGTAYVANDSIVIVGDDDEKYLVNNPNSSMLSSIDNGDRLIVYFSFSKGTTPAGFDYVIDIFDAVSVLYKPIKILTEVNADSIGNDPINVRDLWVAKDYMNFSFQYYGYSKLHFINLIRNPGDITGADTVNLEIRHNDNDDAQSQVINGFVTFDLTSLQGEPGDSVILHVRSKEYDSRVYDKYVTYKF